MKEGYYIEWNGDFWQSVFPRALADLSQLHSTVADARAYFKEVAPHIVPIKLKKSVA